MTLPGTSEFCEMSAPADFHGTHAARAGGAAADKMTAVNAATAIGFKTRQSISVPTSILGR